MLMTAVEAAKRCWRRHQEAALAEPAQSSRCSSCRGASLVSLASTCRNTAGGQSCRGAVRGTPASCALAIQVRGEGE